MKNKKAQFIGFVVIVLVAIGLFFLIYWITPLFFNSGTSTDYVYTVEKTKFWHKLYLKDDHTTVYCFDDERFLPILEQARTENKKVVVTYQDYFFRGFLCSSGNERIGTTVITNVEIIQ